MCVVWQWALIPATMGCCTSCSHSPQDGAPMLLPFRRQTTAIPPSQYPPPRPPRRRKEDMYPDHLRLSRDHYVTRVRNNSTGTGANQDNKSRGLLFEYKVYASISGNLTQEILIMIKIHIVTLFGKRICWSLKDVSQFSKFHNWWSQRPLCKNTFWSKFHQ